MIGIVSVFAATISVPITLPVGASVLVGLADGLTVSSGLPVDGMATGVRASALFQIQPALSPVAASAATTSTAAPITLARPLPPAEPPLNQPPLPAADRPSWPPTATGPRAGSVCPPARWLPAAGC